MVKRFCEHAVSRIELIQGLMQDSFETHPQDVWPQTTLKLDSIDTKSACVGVGKSIGQ